MTLRELAKEWSEHKQRDVAARTQAQYDCRERYVLRVIGHRRVSDLELREIDQ